MNCLRLNNSITYRVALQETLEENERLLKIIDDLKTENASYKQMLDEANSFVEVIKVCLYYIICPFSDNTFVSLNFST